MNMQIFLAPEVRSDTTLGISGKQPCEGRRRLLTEALSNPFWLRFMRQLSRTPNPSESLGNLKMFLRVKPCFCRRFVALVPLLDFSQAAGWVWCSCLLVASAAVACFVTPCGNDFNGFQQLSPQIKVSGVGGAEWWPLWASGSCRGRWGCVG